MGGEEGVILIDSRTGSGELVPLFKPYNTDVESTILDSGDLAWVGNGEDGPVSVGVERKRLGDLIQSMRDDRLAGRQIPTMHKHYSPGHIYLVVEGVWRCGNSGVLETCRSKGKWEMFGSVGRAKPVMYREVSSFLHSVQVTMGVKVIKTGRDTDTVAEMVSLYNWYKKDWKAHHTAFTIYAPGPEPQATKRVGFRSNVAGFKERVAAQLPGIGNKAWEIGNHFKSGREMGNAGVEEWMKVPGVGRKGAQEIVKTWRGD